ncbi:MAG: type II secretion system protein [Phycisphaerales bacterium]
MRHARAVSWGFTLVELLVTISIISLLMGILLPAVSGVRQHAGYAVCLANQKTNASAVHHAINDNREMFPTAPISGPTPGHGGLTGFPGRPALRYATDGLPLNDWRGESAPGKSPDRGWAYDVKFSLGMHFWTREHAFSRALPNLGIEAYWFLVFGQYAVETRGTTMLDEPFLSPAARYIGRKWKEYAEEPVDGTHAEPLHFGSYFYVHPALYERKVFWNFRQGGVFQPGQALPHMLSKWAAFNTFHFVTYPSYKTLFFQVLADHQRSVLSWRFPGARTTVALMDGSARVVSASMDGVTRSIEDLLDDEDVGSIRANGWPMGLRYEGMDNTHIEAFRFTFGGLSGRDFR